MKFLYYIFLVIIIGIKADPSSLSFIHLIPSIINNLRFMQENFIDSNLILNPVSSSVNFELRLNTNGSNCSADMQLFSRDLLARQSWALKSNRSFAQHLLRTGILNFSIRCLGKTSQWINARKYLLDWINLRMSTSFTWIE